VKSSAVASARLRRGISILFRVANYFFLAFGLLTLGYSVYVVVDAHAYQAYEQSKFEAKLEAKSEKGTDSTQLPPPPLVEGGVIGEIQVPRLHLKAIVVQGDSHTILRRAVGHIPETALPGKPGNVALAGHRDTFFRPLRNIKLGDTITLQTTAGDFQYLVESTQVVPSGQIEVLSTTAVPTLTLITCFPFDYLGAAPNRFVVRAREVALPSSEVHSAP
jgi:sortase A